MRRSIVGLFVLLGLLSACSLQTSTSSGDAATPATSVVSSSSTDAASPTADSGSDSSAASAPVSYAATGTATDSQGDTATVSVLLGTPVPQLSLNQGQLTACSSMDNITDGANQTMAIPVQITATLTSSIATDVIVAIDGTHVVAPGGNANTSSWPTMWATYDSNSACVDDGSLEWDNVASGQTVTWSGWELDPEVISPNDPSGSAVNQIFFLEPVVNFGNGNANFRVDGNHSMGLFTCAAGVTGGPVIAVDGTVALANGCTRYSGS
jgi:hypothetical protein